MTELNGAIISKSTEFPCSVKVLKSCSSTNTALKNLAKSGTPEGVVFACEHQTAGRGRLGKSFYSPKGAGVYFSVLLRPTISAQNAVFITIAAAVAVRRAIQKLLLLDTQIKWVNDIYYGEKKFCGILTESALTPQGTLSYAVLGIGMNILPPPDGYPNEFAFKTTNLQSMKNNLPEDIKNQLIAEILTQFYKLYQSLEEKEYLLEYKVASCVIGKEIEILTGPYRGNAQALDIDENANLVVSLPNGETAVLSSGDVSIHL